MTIVTMRLALQRDLAYLVDRQKRFSNQVGFIRRSNLEQLIAYGTVWLADLHGQPAGALTCSGGVRRPLCWRTHLVERELWDNGLGTALTRWLTAGPLSQRWGGLRVRTRQDLSAQVRINETAGGVLVAEHAAGCRGHAIGEWWLPAHVASDASLSGTMDGSSPAIGSQQERSWEVVSSAEGQNSRIANNLSSMRSAPGAPVRAK